MTDNYLTDELKDREIQIIELMAEGLTNRQIGEKLYLSNNTVRWYNKQIYQKFGVNSRVEVTQLAQEWGVLSQPSLAISEIRSNQAHNNLPRPLNVFIGRNDDFSQVEPLLTTKHLLTVVGPAGVGKTRFAIQLAFKVLANYADGVCFVPLASLTHASLVPKAVANHLGLTENLQVTLVETIANYLATRHMLLILDNFEHVMDAADYVEQWLRGCPNLTILLTSREILKWQSEQVYVLEPLSIEIWAESSSTIENEAVQLFVERAQSIQSNLSESAQNLKYIQQICQNLEGLPLAIELAAARSNLFTPHIILEQLTNRLGFLVDGPRDLPQRHRSLQNALDWSFELLETEEQILFRRLGIFQGGFTLENVSSICLQELNFNVVEGIASLFNKSLITVFEDENNEPRFQMLETLREYALHHLVESGEYTDLQTLHATYYLNLVENIYMERASHRQKYWINYVNLEIDNLRNSLQYFYATQQAEAGIRILVHLSWFLHRGSYLLEGMDWFAKFYDLDVPVPPEIKAYGFIYYGDLVFRTGDYVRSLILQKLGLEYAEISEDATIIGIALGNLAYYPHPVMTDGQTNLDLALKSLSYFEKTNDILRICWAKNLVGELYRFQEDYDQAFEYYQMSLEIAEELHDSNRIATTLQNLGAVAIAQKNYMEAIDLSIRTLKHNLESKNWTILAGTLIAMAKVLAELAFYAEAVQLLSISEHIRDQHGTAVDRGELAIFEDTLSLLENQHSTNEFEEFEKQSFTMFMDETITYCVELFEKIRNQLDK